RSITHGAIQLLKRTEYLSSAPWGRRSAPWRNSRIKSWKKVCCLLHGAIRRIEDKWACAVAQFEVSEAILSLLAAPWRKNVTARLRSGARAAPWHSCVIYLRKTEYAVFWLGILEEKVNLKLWIYDF
ncbi:hypothetical protein L195_g035572, partial [Trifolium pratense]